MDSKCDESSLSVSQSVIFRSIVRPGAERPSSTAVAVLELIVTNKTIPTQPHHLQLNTPVTAKFDPNYLIHIEYASRPTAKPPRSSRPPHSLSTYRIQVVPPQDHHRVWTLPTVYPYIEYKSLRRKTATMPKAEIGSNKYLANKMKSKGLQVGERQKRIPRAVTNSCAEASLVLPGL